MSAFHGVSPAQIGHVMRAVRKASGIRLEDLALLAAVSKQTVQDIEHGKPTAQIGKVLVLLSNLGVRVDLVVPPERAKRVSEILAGLSSTQAI